MLKKISVSLLGLTLLGMTLLGVTVKKPNGHIALGNSAQIDGVNGYYPAVVTIDETTTEPGRYSVHGLQVTNSVSDGNSPVSVAGSDIDGITGMALWKSTSPSLNHNQLFGVSGYGLVGNYFQDDLSAPPAFDATGINAYGGYFLGGALNIGSSTMPQAIGVWSSVDNLAGTGIIENGYIYKAHAGLHSGYKYLYGLYIEDMVGAQNNTAIKTNKGLVSFGDRVQSSGPYVTSSHIAPDDSALAAGECAYWFDQTPGASRFMVKAKDANGNTVTGSMDLH